MLTVLRNLLGHQRGQVIVLAVGLMALGLGAIMISVDVGWWLRDKRDAQNDADAIAMAAALELPDRNLAEAAGLDWADFNGVAPGQMEMTLADCPDGDIQGKFCFIDRNSDGNADKVRVKVNRPSKSFISGALGVGAPTLSPPAAAATVYVVGACVMPWGIVGANDDPADHFGLDPEALYVFQNSGEFAGEEGSPGNHGAISIYGEGGSTYTDAIKGICEVQNNACTDDPIVFVDETLIGCSSEPGNMGNPTDKALDERFADSPSPGACDAATYEEALIRVEDSLCEERLVPVAVINAFPPQGSSTDLDIYGIVNFYLAGWDRTKTCFTFPDGSEKCGFVWGYLITNAPASTAEVVFTEDFIPFAPTGIALVE
jgi:hypothetical protein